jgi:pyruvate/2-oxoglutarate dehydrogenase complex dihydrolipoamide acyltransferase (E2) component
MRFLEAKQQQVNKGEHKMQPGIREDQRHMRTAPTQSPGMVPPREKAKVHHNAIALAAELGVDLETVEGTGADGQILARDVRAAHEKNVNEKAGSPE